MSVLLNESGTHSWLRSQVMQSISIHLLQVRSFWGHISSMPLQAPSLCWTQGHAPVDLNHHYSFVFGGFFNSKALKEGEGCTAACQAHVVISQNHQYALHAPGCHETCRTFEVANATQVALERRGG